MRSDAILKPCGQQIDKIHLLRLIKLSGLCLIGSVFTSNTA